MEEYVPKNILITGGAGFIGSHVVACLVTKYPEYLIYNLDKLDYCSSVLNNKDVETLPNYKFIKGDILESHLISYIIQLNQIDTILHFAAQTHVDNSFGNSIEFTKNNILGTHVLLEAARAHGVKRFIHVSTDEVYGEKAIQDDAIETSVLEPTNPYAATKAGAEHIVKSYWKSFKLPVIITRGNNVYGPHQYPEKVIPKFISLLERGRPCCIHGDGSHKRSFLYIDDVVKAFDVILHRGKAGEIYNIGTPSEISTLELAKKLIEKFGFRNSEEWLKFCEDRPFNDCRYSIDNSKLLTLGWKSTISLDEGLDMTIQWYREHFDNWADAEHALQPMPHQPHQGKNGFF